MLYQLDFYVNAQKTIAIYFMVLGVFLLIVAILVYFANTNALLNGLKIGAIILGLGSLVSGYFYKINENKLLEKKTELYKESPSNFLKVEKERMDKVIKNFNIYQIVSIAIIVCSLISIYFIKHNFIKGILFSVILYFIGNMIVENVSKQSLVEYHKQLNSQ